MSESQLTVFTKPADLTAFLQRGRSAVEMALPKHLNPDRMLRLAVTAFSTTPALRECTGQSILASIVVASQIGLEPGVNGQGYLIPYRDNKKGVSICTFVPGWQGLVGLLNNSGRATAWTGAVFDGDEWDFQLGSSPRCVHRPGPNFGDIEHLSWVYACGKVNGSEQTIVEAWPAARVWKHRDRWNKVGSRHYSYQHPEMYARKVVLLQVLKYMPRSIELQNAMTAANAADSGGYSRVEEGVVIDVQPEPEIPQGRVGKSKSVTERAQEERREKAAPDTLQEAREKAIRKANDMDDPEEPAEPEPDADRPPEVLLAGPNDAANRTEITKRLGLGNFGKRRFVETLVEMQMLTEPCAFEAVPSEVLQAALDGWEHVAANLQPK